MCQCGSDQLQIRSGCIRPGNQMGGSAKRRSRAQSKRLHDWANLDSCHHPLITVGLSNESNLCRITQCRLLCARLCPTAEPRNWKTITETCQRVSKPHPKTLFGVKSITSYFNSLEMLVPEAGFEPAHSFERHPLKMVCLPNSTTPARKSTLFLRALAHSHLPHREQLGPPV